MQSTLPALLNVANVDIEDELKTSYLDYAMSVIIGRALPDARDGLKPVHRRALFAMNILNNSWNTSYKKSARIVGDVIGKYHPHGDTAVYDTIVRMAQPFSMRYMLVDGQGNFGSVDGDSAAAMRYTEIRMAKIAHELLIDLDKDTVDYIPNYDGTEFIPAVLPTRVPNLLVNGSSGIAVGMATNIPPHNLAEVINGCLAYIEDEKITTEGLMVHIPGPDFPTGGIINGIAGIKEAYETGRGKVYIRGKAHVETDDKTNRETIIINELPYIVNKARLVEKIAEMVKEKKIEGISGLRDESDKDGMRIVVEIKRDATGEIVLNQLYSQTQLQCTFGINMVALDRGKPKLMTLKDCIVSFINHRREVVTRRTIFDLAKAQERSSILEGLAISLENIDGIIDVIRKSNSVLEARQGLTTIDWKIGSVATMLKMSGDTRSEQGVYRLNDEQAQAILELRLQKLTNMEHVKLLDEYRGLLENIRVLKDILEDPLKLMEVIKEELINTRNTFEDDRRTDITIDTSDINMEDLIPQQDVVLTLSHQGYVKYQTLNDTDVQRRGGKGRSVAKVKDDDFIKTMLVTNTHDTLLCFSSKGRVYWIKVYRLPEASRGARGRPIINLLTLAQDEKITAILPIKEYDKDHNVLMVTARGVIKKTELASFSNPRSSGINAITLSDNDELIGVDITDGTKDVMLFSSAGKVVRFPEVQVRCMGRTAAGVRGMIIGDDDKIVSLIVPNGDGAILTITANGYGKRTKLEDYPTKSRSTMGVISINVTERNGNVISAVQVEESNHVVAITNNGTMVRTSVSEIGIIGRNTQGVTIIRTEDDEQVTSLQTVVDTGEEDEVTEE